MKKKVLVLLVTLSMTIGNVLPVYAMDETEVKQAQETNEFETTDYEAQESFDIETEAVTTIDATEYAENKQCQELADRLGATWEEWEPYDGDRYIKNGFSMEFKDVPETTLGTMISMECEDESVSMYGIKVGTTFNEVKSAMKNCGWPPFANYNSGESGKSIFYLKDFDGGRYYFQIEFSREDIVTNWFWLNWPQGNLVDEPFNDVVSHRHAEGGKGDWYYDYVLYVYQRYIMTGLNETYFGASETLSRAQFATILYRMEGEPQIDYKAVFPDVSDGLFYSNAVIWANSVGIVTGYDDGCFGPSDDINREQMAAMMYRYAKYKGYNSDNSGDLSSYPDKDQISKFAKEPVKWAVGTGLISGDQGKINPQTNASRAVCATIITRFLQKFGQ